MGWNPSTGQAAVIAAGANLLGQGLNYAATANINESTQKWNEKMYGQQRMDAMADWMRQNEYNSPAEQMRRLREAGLNPHLVYGGGANSVSQPIRSTDAKSWNPQVPQVDLASVANTALFKQYDLRMRDAQIDQTSENVKLTKDKQLETQAKVAGILASSARTKQQIAQSEQLFGITLEQAKENVRSTRATIDSTITKNEQLKVLFEPSLQKAVIDVLQSRKNLAKTDVEIQSLNQAIKNAQQDEQLKRDDHMLKTYEINLNKNGVQKNDNIILRKAAEHVGRLNRAWKSRNIDSNMYQDENGNIKFKKPLKFY
jgi:ribosomal protein L25 (general stress protein Ctc)